MLSLLPCFGLLNIAVFYLNPVGSVLLSHSKTQTIQLPPSGGTLVLWAVRYCIELSGLGIQRRHRIVSSAIDSFEVTCLVISAQPAHHLAAISVIKALSLAYFRHNTPDSSACRRYSTIMYGDLQALF